MCVVLATQWNTRADVEIGIASEDVEFEGGVLGGILDCVVIAVDTIPGRSVVDFCVGQSVEVDIVLTCLTSNIDVTLALGGHKNSVVTTNAEAVAVFVELCNIPVVPSWREEQCSMCVWDIISLHDQHLKLVEPVLAVASELSSIN